MHENTPSQGNNENDESEDNNIDEGTAEDEVFDGRKYYKMVIENLIDEGLSTLKRLYYSVGQSI
ncbi:hypothetical protein DICPUDRAFT_150449 [Dictyostelium purpureum]|uniref:Uncharacterized protein n=1 Tax=Dictyostelium purpureum TaxID=5786 RepID=F0ZGD2_DICPU|nr:uncharacterized protein DICPUDRAFT_150449 [Dictyostelium purpureum]EGC36974.1 hypothetical protein DICPUDRAFT_150449 [Dictyostelium purpureum]|eukprot:XP_003286471.1 hypothetical protein DICPUDRAFT_150449 [Dictyostelium purpureum]